MNVAPGASLWVSSHRLLKTRNRFGAGPCLHSTFLTRWLSEWDTPGGIQCLGKQWPPRCCLIVGARDDPRCIVDWRWREGNSGRQAAHSRKRAFSSRDVRRGTAPPAQGRCTTFRGPNCRDGKPAGLLGVADPVKASTREAIEVLHSAGICTAMLTGDNGATAEAVARKLGIAEVEAEVLPEQTTQTVRRAPGGGQEGRDGRRWGK